MSGEENTPIILSDRDSTYVQMLRETSQLTNLAFINPDAFNREHFEMEGKIDHADIEIMRRMIDSQLPGYSSVFDDRRIGNLVRASLEDGPFAKRYGIGPGEDPQPFGLVNLQGSHYDDSYEYMPTVAFRPPQQLNPLPGEDFYWDGFWGVHEGTHLNDTNPPLRGSDEIVGPSEMNRELTSDRAGIAWLRSQGQEDMVQAVIDYRALSAASDPEHAATAILADQPEQEATLEHYQAARNFANIMNTVVANDLEITEGDAQSMSKIHEFEFAGHVRRLLDSGAFDENGASQPYVRDFIEAYTGAVMRRVIDQPMVRPELDNETAGNIEKAIDLSAISGGKPVVTFNEEKMSLSIGNITATAFFASHADPALALERLAQPEPGEPTHEIIGSEHNAAFKVPEVV